MSHHSGSVPPRPDVIPFQPDQPIPWMVQFAKLQTAAGVHTAIERSWDEGDAKRCRLCRRCTANHDRCLILVPRNVGKDEAALFDTTAMKAQRSIPSGDSPRPPAGPFQIILDDTPRNRRLVAKTGGKIVGILDMIEPPKTN